MKVILEINAWGLVILILIIIFLLNYSKFMEKIDKMFFNKNELNTN